MSTPVPTSRRRLGSGLGTALAWVESLASGIAGVLLIIMMLAIFADVAGRYFFNSPISGVRELASRYLMVGTVWLSLARTQRKGGHVAVDILVRRAPEWAQLVIAAVTKLAATIPMGVIVYVTYEQFIDTLGLRTLGAVQLPVAPAWAVVAIGSALLVLRLLVGAVQDVLGAARAFRTPSEAIAGEGPEGER